MDRTRRLFVASALAATGCSVLPGPAPRRPEGPGDGAARPLRVYGNRTTLEVASLLLAAEQVHAPPLPVRSGGIPSLYGLSAPGGFTEPGLADVATHAETQALRYSVEHPDLRIILTLAEGRYRLIARRSAGVARLEDLRGKRIGTAAGTSAEFFLHRMLGSVGVASAEVAQTRITPLDGLADALSSREIDAVAIWDPVAEAARIAIGEDGIVFPGGGIYSEQFNLNTTAGALADPFLRPQIVSLVRAVITASQEIRAEGGRAQGLVAQASGVPLPLVVQSWPHLAFPATLSPDLLPLMVAEEAWLAASAGRAARSDAAIAALIDPTVLQEAQSLR